MKNFFIITIFSLLAMNLFAFEIPFSDNFSSDQGWANQTSEDYVISGGQLNWNADRSIVQKMYIPISEYSGVFQIEFDFQMTYKQNNVWLELGLANSLTGAKADPTNDPVGTFVQFGWTGGGTSYSVYYVRPLVRYENQDAYTNNFNMRDPSTYISYTEDAWYHAKMEVSGQDWILTVTNSSGTQVGQMNGEFPHSLPSYNYVYIGNPDNQDWPEGNGYLDNLSINTDSGSEIDELIAFYPFNGNTNDESGNGHDGTVHGASLTEDRFGNENSAYHFDGSNDYINSNLQNISGNKSINIWINAKELDQKMTFFGVHKPRYEGFILRNTNTGNINYRFDHYNDITTIEVFQPDRWYMVTAIFDEINSKTILYVNGNFIDEIEVPGDTDTNEKYYIGCQNDWAYGTYSHFNGDIDDIKIYSYVLSQSEITNLYHENGWNDQEGELVAYYPFNGNTNDESGNGNDGTVHGASLTEDRFGNTNGAYSFDGVNDYIELPKISYDNKSFTILSWVKINNIEKTNTIFSNGEGTPSVDDGIRYFGIGSDGKLRFDIAIWENPSGKSQTMLDEYEWYYVGISCDYSTNEGKFYINGMHDTTFDISSIWGHLNTNVQHSIGVFGEAETSVKQGWFDGAIDDFRMYNRALSESEISDLYHENGWTGKSFSVPIVDNFSTDQGWTNESDGDFIISGGQLNWNVDRSKVQKMYLPIEEYKGDFQLEFDFQLTNKENNIWLELGLAESLTGAKSDPTNDPVGAFVQFGWTGGGTSYSVYYVRPLVRHEDQDAFTNNFDMRDPSTYISYTEDEWYYAKIEIVDQDWQLTVENASGNQVGQLSGEFPYSLPSYNYVYIGNPDNEDWPEGNGYLDNLSISDDVDWKPIPDSGGFCISIPEDLTGSFSNEEIIIPINTSELQTSDNITAYEFDLTFDNSIINFIRTDISATISDGGMITVDNNVNNISVGYMNATPLTGSGKLLNLVFEPVAKGTSSLDISNFVYNTTEVNNTENGLVTISDVMYGDVDYNDEIQAYDASLVLQYAVGLDPLPSDDPRPWENDRHIAADVDGNGDIQAYDASLILQYAVGLIDVFPCESLAKASSPMADIKIETNDNNLYFYAIGDLYGFDLSIPNTGDYFGNAFTHANKTQMAINNGSEYKVSLMSKKPIKNDQPFLIIPLKNDRLNEFEVKMVINNSKITEYISDGFVAETHKILHNYPNPFNPYTDIKIFVSQNSTPVKVQIYNITGQLINTIFQIKLDKGYKTIRWNGLDKNGQTVSGGYYFCKVIFGEHVKVHKMLLLK